MSAFDYLIIGGTEKTLELRKIHTLDLLLLSVAIEATLVMNYLLNGLLC